MSNLKPADGEHSFSKGNRYARSSFPLATLPNGHVIMVQVRTGHSAGRKTYYSTIGNVRREAGDVLGFAEVSHPMDDKRIANVSAGARYSEKNLKAAHQAALAAVAASGDPQILRYFAADQAAVALG